MGGLLLNVGDRIVITDDSHFVARGFVNGAKGTIVGFFSDGVDVFYEIEVDGAEFQQVADDDDVMPA